MTLTTAAVIHPSGAPSTALRVEDGTRILAFSGDTEWTEALLPIARGADLFVYLESGWEAVDVKASQLSASKAHSQNRFSRAVWTGLDWGDFTGQKGTGHGMLSIPFATADAKCDQFIGNIRQMVTSQQAQRAAARQHAGNKSLRYS